MNSTVTLKGNNSCLWFNEFKVPTSDAYVRTAVATAVVNMVTAPVAAFGNIVVFLLFWRTKRLRKPCYILLMSLSVSDVIVGLILQPIFCVRRLLHLTNNIGCILRVVYVYGRPLCFIVSICNVCFISIDRCLAIRFPFRYTDVAVARTYYLILAFMWMLLISLVGLKFWRIISEEYFHITEASITFLFLGIILICQFAVYSVIYQQRRKTEVQKVTIFRQNAIRDKSDEKGRSGTILSGMPSVQSLANTTDTCKLRDFGKADRSINTTAILVVALMLCYGPQMILLAIRGILNHAYIHFLIMDTWVDTLVFINSSINPFLYCLRLSDFKIALLRFLKRDQQHREAVYGPSSASIFALSGSRCRMSLSLSNYSVNTVAKIEVKDSATSTVDSH